jgi:outer membrane murein-binding lipoprotein Lpp
MVKKITIGLVLLAMVLLASCGMSKEQVEKKVAEMFQEMLDTNAEYQRLQGKVDSVILVKTAANENKYRGEIQVVLSGSQYKLSVSAIADKDAVLYELEPPAVNILDTTVKAAIQAAKQRAADIKNRAVSKTRSAFQKEMDTNARYNRLGVRVRNVELAESEDNRYTGSITVDAGADDDGWGGGYQVKLDVTVTGDGGDVQGDVQYELSPKSVAALDDIIKSLDDVLARSTSACFGTWFSARGQNVWWNGRAREDETGTFVISAGEFRTSDYYEGGWDRGSLTIRRLQYQLVYRNPRYTDYHPVGYRLTGDKSNTLADDFPYIFLHKTDSNKMMIITGGLRNGSATIYFATKR